MSEFRLYKTRMSYNSKFDEEKAARVVLDDTKVSNGPHDIPELMVVTAAVAADAIAHGISGRVQLEICDGFPVIYIFV